MANFKVGSTKTVQFDPDFQTIGSTGFDVWRRIDADRIKLLDIEDDYSVGPANTNLFLQSDLNLIVSQDLSLRIGRFANLTKYSDLSGGVLSYDVRDDGIRFEKGELSETRFEQISSYVGYPIFLVARMFQVTSGVRRDAFDQPTSIRWNADDGVERYVAQNDGNVVDQWSSEEVEIRGWIGKPNLEDRTVPIVDIDGNPIKWTSEFSGSADDTTPIFDSDDPANVPNYARFRKIERVVSDTPQDWVEPPIRLALFREEFISSDNRQGANPIRTAYLVQSPRRIDNDNVIQSATFPTGESRGRVMITRAQTVGPEFPDYSKGSFKAEVLSSIVEPEYVDQLTGQTLFASYHALSIEVKDRIGAGLDDIPLSLSTPSRPQYLIEDIGYYLSSLIEQNDNSIILFLTTRPGV